MHNRTVIVLKYFQDTERPHDLEAGIVTNKYPCRCRLLSGRSRNSTAMCIGGFSNVPLRYQQRAAQDDEFRDFIVDDEPGPDGAPVQQRRRIRRTGLPAGVSGAALRVRSS